MPRDVSKPVPNILSMNSAKLASRLVHDSAVDKKLVSELVDASLRHPCTICAKPFGTKGHLSRHMKIHSGEKKYQCPFPGCLTRAARADNLQQHYRVHLGSRTGKRKGNSRSLEGVVALGTRSTSASTESHCAREATPPLDSPPELELTTLTVNSVKLEDNSDTGFQFLTNQSDTLPSEHSPSGSVEPFRIIQEYMGKEQEQYCDTYMQEQPETPVLQYSESSSESEGTSEIYTPSVGNSYPVSPEAQSPSLCYPPEYVDADGSISPSEATLTFASRPPRSTHTSQIPLNIPSGANFQAEAMQRRPHQGSALGFSLEFPSPSNGISQSPSDIFPPSLDTSHRILGSFSGSSFDGSHPSSPYSEVQMREYSPTVENNPLHVYAEVPLIHPIPRPARLVYPHQQSGTMSPALPVTYSRAPSPIPSFAFRKHSYDIVPDERSHMIPQAYTRYPMSNSHQVSQGNVNILPDSTIVAPTIPRNHGLVVRDRDIMLSNLPSFSDTTPQPEEDHYILSSQQPLLRQKQPLIQSDYVSTSSNAYEAEGWIPNLDQGTTTTTRKQYQTDTPRPSTWRQYPNEISHTFNGVTYPYY